MHAKAKLLLIGLVLFCLGSPGVAHAVKCPHVLFILDASGSMERAPDGSIATSANPAKWTIAKTALQDLLMKYNNKFPIGFNFFPNEFSCGVKSGSDVDVQIRFNTEMQINALLNTLVAPNGGTPTYTAISKAQLNEELQDPTRGEYIVLITDGGPCCTDTSQCGIAGSPYPPDLTTTISEIQKAHDSAAGIKTFVIGFSGNLPAEAQAGLNQMADAGGVPAPQTGGNTDRYYKADSANALTQALSSIFESISAGDAGMSQLCDDSCYAVKCPTGQGCTGGICKANPCSNFICPEGQYCYTDGASAPACKKVCDISCGSGQRCILGQCFATPCPLACGAREACDSSGQCVSDTACSNVRCQPTQGCRNGRCFDDPCTFITCPQDFMCVPFEGTCVAGSDSTGAVRGCHCDLSGRSSLPSTIPALLGGLMAWLLMRRRRRVA